MPWAPARRDRPESDGVPDGLVTEIVDAGAMAGRDGSLTTMISPLEETAVQDARARARLGERSDDAIA